MLECGTLPGMLSTLDFGGGYAKHSLASVLLRGHSDEKGRTNLSQILQRNFVHT